MPQGVLFFMPSQRRIDPGDIGDRGAAERTGKPLRPDRVAGIARAILGNNRAGGTWSVHCAFSAVQRDPRSAEKPLSG
jgi:hypothetical protein